MSDPLDECGGCGADLFDGVSHECPVLGTTVMAFTEPKSSMRRPGESWDDYGKRRAASSMQPTDAVIVARYLADYVPVGNAANEAFAALSRLTAELKAWREGS